MRLFVEIKFDLSGPDVEEVSKGLEKILIGLWNAVLVSDGRYKCLISGKLEFDALVDSINIVVDQYAPENYFYYLNVKCHGHFFYTISHHHGKFL